MVGLLQLNNNNNNQREMDPFPSLSSLLSSSLLSSHLISSRLICSFRSLFFVSFLHQRSFDLGSIDRSIAYSVTHSLTLTRSLAYRSQLRSHGLFGQTWSKITYPNAIKYIQGTVDEYAIYDGDLFGDDFVYNAFD